MVEMIDYFCDCYSTLCMMLWLTSCCPQLVTMCFPPVYVSFGIQQSQPVCVSFGIHRSPSMFPSRWNSSVPICVFFEIHQSYSKFTGPSLYFPSRFTSLCFSLGFTSFCFPLDSSVCVSFVIISTMHFKKVNAQFNCNSRSYLLSIFILNYLVYLYSTFSIFILNFLVYLCYIFQVRTKTRHQMTTRVRRRAMRTVLAFALRIIFVMF